MLGKQVEAVALPYMQICKAEKISNYWLAGPTLKNARAELTRELREIRVRGCFYGVVIHTDVGRGLLSQMGFKKGSRE